MALYMLPFCSYDDISELLLAKQSCEHPQHVVLVVVPLQAVLLGPHGSTRTPHIFNHSKCTICLSEIVFIISCCVLYISTVMMQYMCRDKCSRLLKSYTGNYFHFHYFQNFGLKMLLKGF